MVATRARLLRRRFRRGKSRPRYGTTAVEMAIVSPFIFLLVFASIEFSRVVMVKQALTNAAREGCRKSTLATTLDASVSEEAARYYLRHCFTSSADPEKVRFSATPSSLAEIQSGDEITTTVEVNFSDVSWLAAFWAKDAKLQGSATMKRE